MLTQFAQLTRARPIKVLLVTAIFKAGHPESLAQPGLLTWCQSDAANLSDYKGYTLPSMKAFVNEIGTAITDAWSF